MLMDNIIELLKAVIPRGKENAIHLLPLSEKLGVSDHTAKKYVQAARRNGLMICSGQDGYWITDNSDEIRAFETTLHKQAISRLRTTKPMRDTLKEYKGQISLDDFSKGASEGVRENGKEQRI